MLPAACIKPHLQVWSTKPKRATGKARLLRGAWTTPVTALVGVAGSLADQRRVRRAAAAAACATRGLGGSRGRILVTGGCGYIGSHTVLELLEAKFEVLILDNLCRSDSACLHRVLRLAAEHLHVEVDELRGHLRLKKV
ncbi:UDP-glucose 4-epimerase (Galactowaldenase) (UDP-galactose 4-epimerase), partial [Durusdinium trenchii]